MSFLGPSDLKKFLQDSCVLTKEDGTSAYNKDRVKQASYELSLGSECYRTDNKDRKVEILNESNKNIEINPGQFTLLMTDEYVNIPNDKLAFISIKAKQKLKGLVNVSGFHVDPGYKGKLLFSVYNAGPSTITLEYKNAYFLIWFANLASETKEIDLYSKKTNHHQGQNTISPEYLDALKRGEIASPNVLHEKIKGNEAQIEAVSKSREIKSEKIFWAVSATLALLTTLNVAYWNKNSEYNNGYDDAVKEQTVNDIIKKGAIFSNDSLYLHKIDSLINIKLNKKVDRPQ